MQNIFKNIRIILVFLAIFAAIIVYLPIGYIRLIFL